MADEIRTEGQDLSPVEEQPKSTKDEGGRPQLTGMFQNWFLDYASYVILERAVPHLGDGLKPVQRRILHAMKRLDDGRYNKVANIVGHTMQFHPHGDTSIGDALVGLGQKSCSSTRKATGATSSRATAQRHRDTSKRASRCWPSTSSSTLKPPRGNSPTMAATKSPSRCPLSFPCYWHKVQKALRWG